MKTVFKAKVKSLIDTWREWEANIDSRGTMIKGTASSDYGECAVMLENIVAHQEREDEEMLDQPTYAKNEAFDWVADWLDDYSSENGEESGTAFMPIAATALRKFVIDSYKSES